MTKEFIEKNLVNREGDLLFTKIKNSEYNKYTKEELYCIYHSIHEKTCKEGHPLIFKSFKKGYKECAKCRDLNGFYNLNNLKEYAKSNLFTARHVKKIKEYYNINTRDIYLWNNDIEYCPVCGKEKKIINQTGCAKTCSLKCGNGTPRRKLSEEEKKKAKEKRIKTCLQRYGVSSNLLLIDNKGLNNSMHNEDVRAKRDNTMLERYGTIHPLQNKELVQKAQDTFKKGFEKSTFGDHNKRKHFENIEDYNEDYIRENFIKEGVFLSKEFQDYFNASSSVSLNLMRYFGLWDEKISRPEQIIAAVLNTVDESFVKTKKVIKPYELDFYSEEHNLAVECHGDYWHSKEKGTAVDYHKMKADLCNNKGVFLYQFFENEIFNKQEIIKSMIDSKLQRTVIVQAEDCSIKGIRDDKVLKRFYEDNHIQGSPVSIVDMVSTVNIGLYSNNELVYLSSFIKSADSNYELVRHSNVLGVTVRCGFSSTLVYFEENYNPKNLEVRANRRWNADVEDNLYTKNAFYRSHLTDPVCMFYKNGQYFDTKEALNKDLSKSGHYTLYDAGSIVYKKEYK